MKKQLISLFIGLIIGAILALYITFKLSPGMLLIESASPYDFVTTTQKFEAAVAAEGWRMPAVHDLQATLANFGKPVKAVKVYEICQPEYAAKILEMSEERVASTMMPCRVAIYEKAGGRVYISRINSSLMSKAMGGVINEVMSVAFEDTEKMIENASK